MNTWYEIHTYTELYGWEMADEVENLDEVAKVKQELINSSEWEAIKVIRCTDHDGLRKNRISLQYC